MRGKTLLKGLANKPLSLLGLQLSRRRHPSRAHEPLLREALSAPEPRVLDIGAHEGETVETVMAVNPRARILCFEPTPASFRRLQAKQARYRFECLNLGLGDMNGSLPLYAYEGSAANALLPVPDGAPHRTRLRQIIQVTVRRLDDVMAERNADDVVDLMKIDVQGFERQVLDGAAATLARTRCLITEVHFNPEAGGLSRIDEICCLLHAQGFRFVRSLGYLLDERGSDLVSTDFFFRKAGG